MPPINYEIENKHTGTEYKTGIENENIVIRSLVYLYIYIYAKSHYCIQISIILLYLYIFCIIISFQYEPTDILGRVVVKVKGGTQSPQNACDLHTKGEPAASSCTFKHRI